MLGQHLSRKWQWITCQLSDVLPSAFEKERQNGLLVITTNKPFKGLSRTMQCSNLAHKKILLTNYTLGYKLNRTKRKPKRDVIFFLTAQKGL